MVGNLFSKTRVLDKGLEPVGGDRFLIAGIIAGIALFWVLVLVLAVRLVAAVS